MRGITLAIALLLAAGLAFRLAPLADLGERMLWQWPTEDGYLMMTIARNIALGHGMTISAGEIPTNGTQPLATLVWAGIFWLAAGDRVTGVLLIQLAQIAIGGAGALGLYFLGRRLLADRPWGAPGAALAAALWFASPVVITHLMNGLETGVSLALIIWSVLAWSTWRQQASAQVRVAGAAGIGVLLGLTFLARIDAVFLIIALTGWHAALGLADSGRGFRARTVESFAMGAASMVVASPWLIYNYIGFGSIMPISGTSQSTDAAVASNLGAVPVALFRYITQVFPVPVAASDHMVVAFAAALACLAYFAVVGAALRRASGEARAVALVVATMGLGLCLYYGLFFGARYFIARYMAPWSPFLALATTALVLAALDRLGGARARTLAALGVCAATLVLAIGLNVRIYVAVGRGSAVEHRHVLRWVESNVRAEAWVGAVQTGVLGFFHDRTINLDGKVNPYALAARLEGRIPHYVVATPIEYIADWHGVSEWIELEPLSKHFELAVADRKANLAVLKRMSALPANADIRGGLEIHGRPRDAR